MLHTRSLGGEDVVILKTRSRTFDHFLAVEALCWRMRLLYGYHEHELDYHHGLKNAGSLAIAVTSGGSSGYEKSAEPIQEKLHQLMASYATVFLLRPDCAARVARKATQEDGAAEGDGEVSSDQEPPLVERLAQDANAIPGVGESAGVNPGMETSRVKEECAREGDTQASVRDAGLVESPDVVDLASGSPPSEKVELPNDLVVKIKQAPTRVRADACNHDADANPGVSLSA
ncbi:hypothetical protein PC116_g27430 [Phytophthora cactorum]|nr:hypothetical protein PC116_g27430 [Phytophthora cactorum]